MDKTFKPTVDWMTAKYAEMNDTLFNGKLGGCSFKIFTTGRGSEGGVLGWFKIGNRNIRVNRYTRVMFVNNGEKTRINRENFVSLCNPIIELNGNYTGTEYGFLATLVHEMCHYYTYMDGWCPKQCHGREFKNIGSVVSARSKGMFTIQRLATAEEMSQLELSDEMKAKREKRLTNKKSSMYAVFRFMTNGDIQLTTTSSKAVIQMIVQTYMHKDVIKVLVSNDSGLIELLFNNKYTINFRGWRFWHVNGKDWMNELDNFEFEEYVNPFFGENKPKNGETTLSIHHNQPKKRERTIFSIRTSNGVYETEYSSVDDLFNKLRERFPKMSGEAITKLINNKANHKTITENMVGTRKIIMEVIKEFIRNNSDDDSVAINPDMNLGVMSPLDDA